MWLSDSKQTLMMGAAVHCAESILQIRWVKNVVVQCSVCTERGPEAITDLSSQAARIAHEGNILFMAALNAMNPPLTAAPVPSPDSRPLLTPTPVPSSDVSGPSNLNSDPHPAAPTRDSAQTSEQLRNELWRLSMEYSEYIVDEVFKPQIMELLSMGGDGFDSRSGPGIIVRALDYVRSVWPSDSEQILMMGAAVHCVESILQIRWVKNVVVQCSACTERGPETIKAVLEHIGREHSGDGHDDWEWYTRKWPLRLPIKEVGMLWKETPSFIQQLSAK